MGKIYILPQNVISQIAAGEVVQRPANVVKELVENSIDAGASKIKINLADYGFKKIEVSDDGIGMSQEDLLQSFLLHSTSKLISIEDLNAINSLGFRGEALNSIASVSKMTIKSRTAESIEGFAVTLNGGNLEEGVSVGIPVGTVVTVENLFFNIPARKKFLKTPQTELSHIINVVSNLALANCNVGFELINNKKTILRLPASQNLDARIAELLGDSFTEQFVTVEYIQPHISIIGFVSRPQHSTKSSRKKYLFVNNRVVNGNILSSVVKNAYGNLLEASAQPAFLLYLGFLPDFVDVNVHPRKEEVRFINQAFVNEAVKTAVIEALQKQDLTYINQGFISAREFLLKDLESSAYGPTALKPATDADILQIHNLYLIKQTEKGVLFVDQHAAHERILYEKFVASFEKEKQDKKNQIELNYPIVLSLSASDKEVLHEHRDLFDKLGFTIEDFGSTSFKVTKIPKILLDRNVSAMIEEILDNLANETFPNNVDEISLKAISYIACRSAIKSGDYLSPEQRSTLLNDLENTKTNYTCPHGRPAKVEIPLRELEKMFKRQ